MPAETTTETENIKASMRRIRRSMPTPPIQNMIITTALWNNMIQDPGIEIPATVRVAVVSGIDDLALDPGVMPPDFQD